ncbi:MAG TPA: DUF6622 family protein [Spirochaetia bacterium]|nr:DUF6622 family protein [Spirochaetia bacterium]
MVVQILSHVPTWVVAVLLYGVAMGIRAMFARNVSLVAVSIVPLVFLGLSLTSLVASIRAVPVSAPVWAVGLSAGIIAGATIFSARILDSDAGVGRLRIAGSPITLVLFVLIFATKFYYNFHIAIDPSAASNIGFVSTTLALSGISTGIMVGRVWKLFAGYFGRNALNAAR